LKIIEASIVITAGPNYSAVKLLLENAFFPFFLAAHEWRMSWQFRAFIITKVPISCQGRQYLMWTDTR